jgi:hypothetical protein
MKRIRTWRIISIVAVVIGTGMFWGDTILFPLIIGRTGGLRTDGVFVLLTPFVLHVLRFLTGAWFYDIPNGIPILFGGVMGLTITWPLSRSGSAFTDTHRLGLAAIAVGVCAHLLVFAFSLNFFFVPAGAGVRPMVWVSMMFGIAAFTFLASLPLIILAMFKERPRFFSVVALALSLTPIFFAMGMLFLAAAIKGFVLES